MEALQDDMLVCITEKLTDPRDLWRLRLVNKRFHAAVGQSSIKLIPYGTITSRQLVYLSEMFNHAVSLDLRECPSLVNGSLKLITRFSQLRCLIIKWCDWLTTKGVAHLGRLHQLETLILMTCMNIEALPEAISGLRSLQCLHAIGGLETISDGLTQLTLLQTLRLCGNERLAALPAGLSSLTALHTLHLSYCQALQALPEGIGALSLLTELNLNSCESLAVLPDSVSGLASLQNLNLYSCNSLVSLPGQLVSLSALVLLDLRHCSALAELPEGLRDLAPRLKLSLFGCLAEDLRLANAAEGNGT